MLPELGRYAVTVLAAYGATIALIGGLVALTLMRAARIRRALAEAERSRLPVAPPPRATAGPAGARATPAGGATP